MGGTLKPRTQAELDALYEQYPGLEDSMQLAAYVDAGVQRDRNKWQYAQNGEYDSYDHSDIKHPQTFPAGEYTILRGGKPV